MLRTLLNTRGLDEVRNRVSFSFFFFFFFFWPTKPANQHPFAVKHFYLEASVRDFARGLRNGSIEDPSFRRPSGASPALGIVLLC